ncbi:hypothetical protein BamIOP4010DRAFT_6444 [Burkholderia ambifaria IOP40-10]|uniref:Uncharacterized protein n=1 Tax=Burkholderia ambifaria IOP40-10 TaxID=396596 RepID=B1FQY3_9BURK|nr:hypothetical protein BamIOP4010DRAFT_6444 [Burkholderia ambifaria IOP40-10]
MPPRAGASGPAPSRTMYSVRPPISIGSARGPRGTAMPAGSRVAGRAAGVSSARSTTRTSTCGGVRSGAARLPAPAGVSVSSGRYRIACASALRRLLPAFVACSASLSSCCASTRARSSLVRRVLRASVAALAVSSWTAVCSKLRAAGSPPFAATYASRACCSVLSSRSSGVRARIFGVVLMRPPGPNDRLSPVSVSESIRVPLVQFLSEAETSDSLPSSPSTTDSPGGNALRDAPSSTRIGLPS